MLNALSLLCPSGATHLKHIIKSKGCPVHVHGISAVNECDNMAYDFYVINPISCQDLLKINVLVVQCPMPLMNAYLMTPADVVTLSMDRDSTF